MTYLIKSLTFVSALELAYFDEKYECSSSCQTFHRFFGSNRIILVRRSSSISLIFGHASRIPLPGNFGHVSFQFQYFFNCGISCSVGVPSILKILKIWSISQSPVKSGLPVSISANTHPTAHISIAPLYLSVPSSISIALYYRLPTIDVNLCVPKSTFRESPKSEIMAFPYFSSILSGFMSL